MTVHQPAELVRLLRKLPVTPDGEVKRNLMASQKPFVSKMYESNYFISVLARFTLRLIDNGTIVASQELPLPDDSIPYNLIRSNLNVDAPEIHLLIRTVVLESLGLVYHIQEDRASLQYFTRKDVLRVKENINYITDYLSSNKDYYYMIEFFRDLHTSLGYIEHQLNVIMTGGAERE